MSGAMSARQSARAHVLVATNAASAIGSDTHFLVSVSRLIYIARILQQTW